MLEVKNVRYTYEEDNAPTVRDISFTVGEDERVGIYAPSGYGKTTLLRILGGYLMPEVGSIMIDGAPIPQKGYCPIQMIWQHPEKAVNPRLKMCKILEEGNPISAETMRALGIEEDWLSRYPTELSGGELQRFCIARALGEGTKYLLADEIETMLDVNTQSQLWNFLITETARRKIGMIIVSHNHKLLEKIATRTLNMEEL